MSSLQLNILILSLGLVQGIFLCSLLFKKRKALPGFAFLAVYLCIIILQVTMKLASKIWLMQNVRLLYSLSYELPFLYGPLIYLFVRCVITQCKGSMRDGLHFLPAMLSIICMLFPQLARAFPFIFFPFMHAIPAMLLQLISIAAYHSFGFYLLRKINGHVLLSADNPAKYQLPWIFNFILCSFVVCSVIAVTLCILYYKFPFWQNARFGFAAFTIFIYWISYKVWMQPELFSIIRGNLAETSGYTIVPKFVAHLPARKYSNSGLAEEEIGRIVRAIENKMQVDKPWLEADLSIDRLAESISCSRHHLSQVLNDELDKSFYDYINYYRIEEAKRLLTDDARAAHKIASIAFDAGFNSLSTFNDVFKRMTGVTPSQYRKLNEQKTLQQQRI